MKKLNAYLSEYGDLDMSICNAVKRKYGDELGIAMYGKFNRGIMSIFDFVLIQKIKLKEKQNG